MTVQVTTPGELVQLRAAGRLAWQILQQIAAKAQVGVRTSQLAANAEELILAAGATPTSKGFTFEHEPPFPSAISVSVNDEVMFALPGPRVLDAGDVVTIDLTLGSSTGWHVDVATTVAIAEGPRAARLVHGAHAATASIIDAIRPGLWWSKVMERAEEAVGRLGLHLLPGPVGHGIGRSMHEQPSLFHATPDMPDVRLRPGMVLAIEPVVIEAPSRLIVGADRWTAMSDTGAWSAFEERIVAITTRGVELLTQ